jgi:hypothetical protein
MFQKKKLEAEAARRRVELVDEGEGVAGGLRDCQHPLPHGVLLVPAIAEGVEAGGGVHECDAGPGLHVAKAPREPWIPDVTHPLHLRRRLPELFLHITRQAEAAACRGELDLGERPNKQRR